MPAHPTRWCSQCEVDWPALQVYNLCPKCGRNTKAETAEERPDETAAASLRSKYEAFAKYLQDSGNATIAALEAVLAKTPSIPDPATTPNPPPFKRWGVGNFPDDAIPDGA